MILSAPCLASIQDYKITLYPGVKSEYKLRKELKKQHGKLDGIRIIHLPQGYKIEE